MRLILKSNIFLDCKEFDKIIANWIVVKEERTERALCAYLKVSLSRRTFFQQRSPASRGC
ncbi:hypothetical protein A359_00890 [secondary endosymbiont of Ctenarytaina eucalypti]|uniref:Uncharacterized protein n=1 Tax=secondary endosymbiont of Ctenarytaina eucalypti TaxID=1199245 RepID=J3YR61_9ENTR|nr:hypothetical protein A359_00890 [secondary endosymbiont of Ctenarytaina eucalypti]